MKKLLLAATMACICAYSAKAIPRDCMLLHFTNGSKLILPVAQEPKILFNGNVITIMTEQYLLSNISKYTFEDSETVDIKNPTNKDYSYSKNGNQVTIKLASSNINVKLFTISGLQLPVDKTDKKMLSIDLNKYTENILLLQVGNETVKITRT
ncbi:hypothetical protein [uncultured Prevotella sp.]|uniref:hypothetical protein n=1 Tax=uncultured Prevotella sp. TaxID=159272 RepID=UPI002624CD8B|nr:hypothetical protein [uncultured Prevotella sp.]